MSGHVLEKAVGFPSDAARYEGIMQVRNVQNQLLPV